MKQSECILILKRGGIGVYPTDTLFGLLGSALNRRTVKRIYKVRERNPKKPFIVLLSSVKDLKRFDIYPTVRLRTFLKKVWPGPVSVILDCPAKKFDYLHRGVRSLAFRIPASRSLRIFLKKTGPLVAPTANIEGEPPAETVREAKRYFGDSIDFYFGNGRKQGSSSTLVRILR